jgi:hypothetical protein
LSRRQLEHSLRLSDNLPSWGEILNEITASVHQAAVSHVSPFDFVRRKYLATVHALTQRAVILYATRWTVAGGNQGIPSAMLSISPGDIQGFMEALHGIKETELDLIIHSPGGSAEAAEAIVLYLRAKFNHIRVFVPHMAMSAATMIACAADEIYMGKHSFIGPIDPQITLQTGLGMRMVAAQAIIDQFAKAVAECQDPAKIRAWLPMLTQYGPDLLISCENANILSKELVSKWLASYMFKSFPDPKEQAEKVANWMANHNEFKTHGRPISRDDARAKGMNIVDLEADQLLQDAILSTYHATTHTFASTPTAKIVENHLGKAFVEMAMQQQIAFPMPFPMPQLLPGGP